MSPGSLRLSRVLAGSLAVAVTVSTWEPFGSGFLIGHGPSFRRTLIVMVWLAAFSASFPRRMGSVPSQGVWAASWIVLLPLALFCWWRYADA